MSGYQTDLKRKGAQRNAQSRPKEGSSFATSAKAFASFAFISISISAAVLMGIPFLSRASTARTRQPRQVGPGVWGGQHVRLEVKKDSSLIEYDCAHGTIDQPLVLDRHGRFDVIGTHTPEHGGPVRRDEKADTRAARYTGWTDGEQMKLTVRLSDTNEMIGTFTLSRGNEGRVFKCR